MPPSYAKHVTMTIPPCVPSLSHDNGDIDPQKGHDMQTMTTINWDTAFAERIRGMRASEIRDLLRVMQQPGMISFAGGIPDPELFPVNRVRAATDVVLADKHLASSALQYAVSEGYGPLREWIAGYMTGLGVPCLVDNIVITNGSQQGLDLLGKLFIGSGGTVLVAGPTYLGALQAFNPYQPRYADIARPIPDSG